MQALSTAPVDMTTASPQAATASPQTGQDGLFASRLKTATENRATTAKKSETPPQQSTDAANTAPAASTPAADDQHADLAADIDHAKQTEDADDQSTLAASLNGAAAITPPAVRENTTNAGTAPADADSVAASMELPAPPPAPAALTGKTQARQESVTHENIVPQDAAATATKSVQNGAAAPATPVQSSDAAVAAATIAPLPETLPLVDDHPLAQKYAATADLLAAQHSDSPPAGAADPIAVPSPGEPTATPSNPTAAQRSGQTIFSATDLTATQSAEQTTAAATAAAATAAAATAAAATSQASGLAPETESSPNGPQLVQNQYGQILAIHQTGEPEEDESIGSSLGKTGSSGAEGKSMDINNNYIHSHLPGGAPKNAADKGDGQQADNASQNQQSELIKNTENNGAEPQATADQLAASKGQLVANPENQGLVFAHQRSASPLTPSVVETGSSLYRLPTGTAVPEGTVVDQMISHFSVNKQLETGSVNLRLYPQELGELRMEIKVEQDNVKAHIVAQNPQAQEMIDRHLPRLREALEQQGLHLQHVEVTIAANDNAGNERFQKNSGWRQPHHSSKNNQSVFSLNQEEDADEAIQALSNLSVLA
jgi:flagellar hook-length control protein FliK